MLGLSVQETESQHTDCHNGATVCASWPAARALQRDAGCCGPWGESAPDWGPGSAGPWSREVAGPHRWDLHEAVISQSQLPQGWMDGNLEH